MRDCGAPGIVVTCKLECTISHSLFQVGCYHLPILISPKCHEKKLSRRDKRWCFVCGSTISTASACSTAVRAAARGLALSLIPSCLGISGHTTGSRQGHPRYIGARSAGRPWVDHEIRQHSTQCRNTPNMFQNENQFRRFRIRSHGM